MTVEKLAQRMGARMLTRGNADAEVSGALVCDVMSGALARGFRGMVWITHQSNMNALAVAVMTEAACLIFPQGIQAEQPVLERAEIENIVLLTSDKSAFDIAGAMWNMGVRGKESL